MLRPTRYRAALLAILVLPLVALAGCGDSPTDTGDDDVRGVWVGQDGGATVYIEISNDEVGVYLGSHSTCFEHIQYEIESRSGDTYTISLPGTSFTEELIIRRSGDQLEIRDPSNPNSSALYNSSSENTAELELCLGGGADPDIVCSELPRIAVGESVTGELTSTDPTSIYGAHYDLYRLQLSSSQQVTIDLRSDDIDSYLVLYDEDGGKIAENDDEHDDTVDASLTLNLSAGCYRVEATSYDVQETGSYTLSVD